MEALGSRVNMIEAERQQSEARVKEEVDASLGQKMGAIDQVGKVEAGRVKKDGWVATGKLVGRQSEGAWMSLLVKRKFWEDCFWSSVRSSHVIFSIVFFAIMEGFGIVGLDLVGVGMA